MDKLDEQLLKKIESVLGFTFYDWQYEYLLGNITVLSTGRGTGKTITTIIKKLFLRDTPIIIEHLNDARLTTDWYTITDDPSKISIRYACNYIHDMLRIADDLKKSGITPREIIIDTRTKHVLGL